MAQNQEIKCTVTSCKFYKMFSDKCALEKITVRPCKHSNTGNPEDESMCGDYIEK